MAVEPGEIGHHRNLNPTLAARVAMIIWGQRYAAQRGGSMDFWDQLSTDEQSRCEMVVRELKVHTTEQSGGDT